MKRLETRYIVAIIISLIIGASIVTYGYLDYKYKTGTLENKKRAEDVRKLDLEKCLADAKHDQSVSRLKYCAVDKKEILNETCLLSRERVDYLNERYDEDVSVCMKKYPQL